MTYTKQSRPTVTFTKQAKPTSGKQAIFSIARFGQARFGVGDFYTKGARPTATMTKQARPV